MFCVSTLFLVCLHVVLALCARSTSLSCVVCVSRARIIFNVNVLTCIFIFRLYCCRHCYTTESRSWHHGSQNKVILCDDCRIYYKKYGKLPATDETREPPPYMFKVVVERELRDEDGYVVNGKLALRSRRAIPPVQTTLRSGRNKTASPVEGILRSFVT